MEKQKISENTPLTEVLKIPGATEVLLRNNFPCIMCPLAFFEIGTMKLGDVIKAYNLDAEKIIKELNQLIEQEEKKQE
ncbi:MAG: hypothetical protein QXU01_02570 [Candidatus Hadarchaeales archaeon]